ncbi:MAG: phosphate ABC transporter ATP-binding protein [Candidatus Omnitrophica bacterium]|nr:phosphate ABC transporter ATP-binding protein [Candidatus Omnitrophota bacterium]
MVIKFQINNFNAWFAKHQVLNNVNFDVISNEILSVIGPSNSGKTTFLRSLNRLNDLAFIFRSSGEIKLNDKLLKTFDIEELRRSIGMVFALPLPLPLSIFDNVAYGLKVQNIRNKKTLKQRVEKALKEAYLFDEVKDRLNESAFKLSGGQQQRLCIARTLAVEPEVILFDEPCSGLDPISTAKVEEAMLILKNKYTIILVTNNVKQAARVGDRTAFFLNGDLVEIDKTEKVFTAPADKRTNDYIIGKFG